jgi:hypothetical protein
MSHRAILKTCGGWRWSSANGWMKIQVANSRGSPSHGAPIKTSSLPQNDWKAIFPFETREMKNEDKTLMDDLSRQASIGQLLD